MLYRICFLFFLGLTMTASTFAQKGKTYTIHTDYGNIKVRLFEDTPLHAANFEKLVKEGYYNGTTFHRVIKQFMIQGGDPNTKDTAFTGQPGMGGPGYTLPAEIGSKHLHFKGALAAARQGDQVNPKKESSGSQFYIVQGAPVPEAQLDQMTQQLTNSQKQAFMRTFLDRPENQWIKTIDAQKLQKENPDSLKALDKKITAELDAAFAKEPAFKYSTADKEKYKTMGGTPHLDLQYTVFGEVVEGLDVVDKIALVETMPGDKPKINIRITITQD